MTLTANQLREVLSYDPDTGEFTWLIAMKGTACGTVAGNRRPDGYKRIRVCGELHYSHRLAFLYMTGKWPKHHVDHINRNPSDNRWANLREATASQNLANSYRGIAASGLKGAYRGRWKNNKWRSYISVNRKNIFLGVFDTAEEAHEAYRAAAAEYFGGFAMTREDAA